MMYNCNCKLTVDHFFHFHIQCANVFVFHTKRNHGTCKAFIIESVKRFEKQQVEFYNLNYKVLKMEILITAFKFTNYYSMYNSYKNK